MPGASDTSVVWTPAPLTLPQPRQRCPVRDTPTTQAPAFFKPRACLVSPNSNICRHHSLPEPCQQWEEPGWKWHMEGNPALPWEESCRVHSSFIRLTAVCGESPVLQAPYQVLTSEMRSPECLALLSRTQAKERIRSVMPGEEPREERFRIRRSDPENSRERTKRGTKA